jgi:glucose/arabinose dehydrogenase
MNHPVMSRSVRGVAVVLLAAAAACGRGDREAGAEAPVAGVEISEVRLGTSVGPDQRVAAETDQFAPGDSIYASVATQGSANNANLTARWTYEDGQLVDESRQTISPMGPANTAFHIYNPAGWPTGRYQVEILINNRAAQTRDFTVR